MLTFAVSLILIELTIVLSYGSEQAALFLDRMMKERATFIRLALVVICSVFAVVASAEPPGRLNGTWVIDSKSTEENLLKLGPPPKNREWLAGMLGFMFVTTLTFADDTLTVSRLGPFPTPIKYQLGSSQSDKLEFQLMNPQGDVVETLVISFVGSRNIAIKSSKMEFQEYALWRHRDISNAQAVVGQGQNTYDARVKEVEQGIGEFKAMIRNIPFLN